MQNTILHWFLYACFLLSPLGLAANVAAKTATKSALATADAAKMYRHFPKANPLDRFRIVKKTGPSYENRPNTEESSDLGKTAKKARSKRFWTIFGSIIGGLTLIYLLQGSIWLAVIATAILLYLGNRKKIDKWEHERYVRSQKANDATPEKDSKGRPIYPLSHPANKWTRRAINRFAIGVAISSGGLLFLLLALASEALIPLAIIALAVGYIFSLIGFFNALQALNSKEPKSNLAWIVIILGIPSVISLLSVLFTGLFI